MNFFFFFAYRSKSKFFFSHQHTEWLRRPCAPSLICALGYLVLFSMQAPLSGLEKYFSLQTGYSNLTDVGIQEKTNSPSWDPFLQVCRKQQKFLLTSTATVHPVPERWAHKQDSGKCCLGRPACYFYALESPACLGSNPASITHQFHSLGHVT